MPISAPSPHHLTAQPLHIAGGYRESVLHVQGVNDGFHADMHSLGMMEYDHKHERREQQKWLTEEFLQLHWPYINNLMIFKII